MEHSEDKLSGHDSGASLDDGGELRSEACPALPPVDPVPPEGDAPSGISEKALRDFVAQSSVQDAIRRIVFARVASGAPSSLVDDLAQEAVLAMLAAKSRPASMETASGWVSIVTVRTVANHYRKDETHRTWLDPEADVEQAPGEPEDDPADTWLIAPWLAPILEHHPDDKETYELLLHKARTAKPYRDVAAEHGITTSALKSRVHEFKTKYERRWRRRQTMFVLLILAGVVAVSVLLAWLVGSLTRPADIKPDRSPRVVPAAPSATASAQDTPFEPALSSTAKAPPAPRPDDLGKPPGR
ncbi:MAG: RNA polymerase sigma factor [Polyangiaceae bacterium]|jgi:DNA-directed RNA polymerase specialized sigma24 family protein